jgi:signal transduction histidine kinase
MTQAWFDRFMHWATPHLPRRFQEGRSPYLFFLVWVLIVAMVALAFITSYPYPLTLVFAGVLLVLLVCYARGMTIQTAVNLGLLFALGEVLFVAAMSGGIFSPRMAWLAVLPLVPFYAVSRRSGWVWLGICLAAQVWMAIMTWQRGPAAMDALQPWSSFASSSIVMLVIMTVPFLYDNLYIQAYNARKKRNQELEDKRQELLRTSALREQFIATVSHELRTPMNAILGFNAMLLARVKDNPQALKILNHTRQSADHLLTVINDVLDYSQLQAGKLNVHPEVFELRETVQTAFALFEARVESMHLSYHCEIGDTVPQWVKADRHRLMQVLVNLLGNAIKFTHQGAVTLRVQQLPLCVLFSVKDSGIGIAQDQQAKIFQRFVQADDDIQSRYGGNGLGLSISQRLVELMGGHIGFESQAGQGSTFWFSLPLTEVPPAPVEVMDTAIRAAGSEGVLRFLVVDDHPVNRVLARQILQNTWNNCELVDADNGAKALEMLRTQAFDLVLMDMVMPEMDGIEATRALRHDLPAPACHTPVLGLTANVNPHDLERFAASGVNAVLLKPFDQAKMCAQVELLLKEKKSSLGS